MEQLATINITSPSQKAVRLRVKGQAGVATAGSPRNQAAKAANQARAAAATHHHTE
jgi:hypothetical protein